MAFVKTNCVWLLLAFSLALGSSSQQEGSSTSTKWEGELSFKDDFDGFEVNRKRWLVVESCDGKGKGDKNLECYVKLDSNIRVVNGTATILAIHNPLTEMKLYGRTRLFTSSQIRTKRGFSYGTFVVSAKMAKGKFLLPTIWLAPAYGDHDNCKYEEIEIAQVKGNKTANLRFSASFGRRWNAVATQRAEKAFPGVDFSDKFHEYALVWKPLRLEWYVDGIKVHTLPIYHYSDWVLSDESNVPCSKNKSLFNQSFQLAISLPVGGHTFDHEGNTAVNLVREWSKPEMEVDWVKIYQTPRRQ